MSVPRVQDSREERVLIVGPAAWLHGARPESGDRFAVVRLAPSAAMNTTLLSFPRLLGARFAVHGWDPRTPGVAADDLESSPFSQLRANGKLRDAEADSGACWWPLFLLCVSERRIAVHAQVRFGPDEALFVRATTLPPGDVAGTAGDLRAAITHAVDAVAHARLALCNHQSCQRTFRLGESLEQKLTIIGPVDVLGLALTTRAGIGTMQLTDWSGEYDEDFLRWDFDNYLFETSAVGDEGYISFIPQAVDGGATLVERTWSSRAPARGVQRWLDGVIPDYRRYLDERGVDAVLRGVIRCIRFDVKLESMRTGNVFTVRFDRCTTLDRPGLALYQVEIAYLHSRTLDPRSQDHLDAEITTLLGAVEAQLQHRGVTYRNDQISKLDYLRSLSTPDQAAPP